MIFVASGGEKTDMSDFCKSSGPFSGQIWVLSRSLDASTSMINKLLGWYTVGVYGLSVIIGNFSRHSSISMIGKANVLFRNGVDSIFSPEKKVSIRIPSRDLLISSV